MRKQILGSISIALLVACHSVGSAEDAGHNHRPASKDGSRIQLSDELRGVLAAEMGAIQTGMQELVPAIASGAWIEIARIAVRMEESYIMRQKLSAAQVKELHEGLPEGFQALDEGFHETAGRLAQAAEKHDGLLAGFYFYKLTESCVQCHARYAGQRFPGFGTVTAPAGHHH